MFSTRCRRLSPGASLASQGAHRVVNRTRPQPVTPHAPEARRQTQARPARRGWEAGLQDRHGCSVRMDNGRRRADAPGKRQRPLRPATTLVMPDGERGHQPGCWTDGTEAAPTSLLDGGPCRRGPRSPQALGLYTLLLAQRFAPAFHLHSRPLPFLSFLHPRKPVWPP